MNKSIIQTTDAPAAIGTYSQAVRVDHTVYLSGQIGLDPASMQMVEGIDAQIHQVFKNLAAVAAAAGGSLGDVVKLNVFLTDLGHFPKVNEIMAGYFNQPYPARAAVGVAALPRGALVEADAVMVHRINSQVESGLAVFLSSQPGDSRQTRQARPHPRRRSGVAPAAALGRRNPHHADPRSAAGTGRASSGRGARSQASPTVHAAC